MEFKMRTEPRTDLQLFEIIQILDAEHPVLGTPLFVFELPTLLVIVTFYRHSAALSYTRHLTYFSNKLCFSDTQILDRTCNLR